MSFSNYAENKIMDSLYNADSYTVAVPWVALHDGDPGETGTSEVTGGSYVRQNGSTVFGASSGGTVANSGGAIEFAGMPAVTVVAVSVWDDDGAPPGNVHQISFLTDQPAVKGVFTAEADDDLFTAKGHGLSASNRITFSAEGLGTTLPTGISAGTLYFVLAAGLTTDAFKVSTTDGGAAVDLTTDGNGAWLRVVPQVVAAGNTFRLNTNQFTASAF